MTNPFWLSLSPCEPDNQIRLLALPRWVELSLKSVGMPADAPTHLLQHSFKAVGGDVNDYIEKARTILSQKEFGFHNDVTDLLDAYLFGGDWMKRSPEEIYVELVRAWHGVPLTTTLDLNLHPVIVGPSTIALMNSEPIPGVTDVNLYERLVRCIYTLSSSKVGLNALDTDLFKAVLNRYMDHRSVKAA